MQDATENANSLSRSASFRFNLSTARMSTLFPGLAKLVKTQYSAATKSGAIQFVESEVEDVEEEGVTVSSLPGVLGPR